MPIYSNAMARAGALCLRLPLPCGVNKIRIYVHGVGLSPFCIDNLLILGVYDFSIFYDISVVSVYAVEG